MSYRRLVRYANPKSSVHNRNVGFVPQTFYALRLDNGTYIDPKKITNHRASGKDWIHLPSAQNEPVLNPSRDFVVGKWRVYEADRRMRLQLDDTLFHNRPTLHMVEFKTGFVSETVDAALIDPMEIRALLVGYHYGEEARTAFRLLVETGTADEYRYALRRKGGKALMDELMSDNFSYGSLTFLRDEVELVQARLILGDGRPAIYFDLVEYPVTK